MRGIQPGAVRMSTYDFSYGAQRITVARLAEKIGLPTTRPGSKRRVAIGIQDLRIAIVNRCLGPDLGTVGGHCKNALQIDQWLASAVVANYLGELGWTQQQAQRAMREAFEARWVRVQAWQELDRAKTRAKRSRMLSVIEEANREERQWLDVARVLMDLIEIERDMRADGYDLEEAEEATRAARREHVARHAAASRQKLAELGVTI